MSTPHHTKSGGKAGRKLDPPSQKSDHAPGLNLKTAKPPVVSKPIEATVAAPVAATAAIAAVAPATVAAPIAAGAPVAVASPSIVTSTDAFSVRGATPAKTPSIDFQTIAMAYGDYTKKSYEQTKTYVEKLAGVRSLDKAIEIQTEFAKQAYETFVHESQKIRELYSGLAKQTVDSAVAKILPAAR